MKRNDKFYKEKKLRKEVREYDKLRDKHYGSKKKTFVGWKRRKRVSTVGKKQAFGQDLDQLVNLMFVWQRSSDKKEWYPKDEWFKSIDQSIYVQLPANIQYLLDRDTDPVYESWLADDKNKYQKWTISCRYERYLYVKTKEDVSKKHHRYWSFCYEKDEVKLRDKLETQGAWVKLFGDYNGYHHEALEELRHKKEDQVKKELKHELDLQ